jgi:hypothetical protein
MSELSPPIEGEDEDANDEGTELQFDQAEPTTPTSSGPTCAGCKRPITDVYYEINGKVICTSCRQHIEASFRGGSGLARLVKASLLGLGAAILGAALYFIVCRVTGLNIGLVAIVVGFMVGASVRKGTGNRGGFLYQIMALLLTYFAIGLMGLTFFFEDQIKEFRQNKGKPTAVPAQVEKPAATVKNPPKAPVVAVDGAKEPKGKSAALPKEAPLADNAVKNPPKAPVVAVDGAKEPKGKAAALPKDAPLADNAPKAPVGAAKKSAPIGEEKNENAAAQEVPPENVGLAKALFLLVFVAGFLIAAGPVLTATQAPISGLIYCFALWQAWVLNKRRELAFSGPFRVSQDGSSGSDPGVLHDGG